MSGESAWDVIVIGGGPAGLSAALVLGRCCRRVLVVDAGQPRNAASPMLHGFLSRDGIDPADLLRTGREQLRNYKCVEFRKGDVSSACRVGSHFEICLRDGTRESCRRLLFATGVVDVIPEIDGAKTFYGRGVYHCPYCDGYEARQQRVAVYGKETKGVSLAQTLLCWTSEVVLCTDGPAALSKKVRDELARRSIGVRMERVERLEGKERLERLVFANGDVLPCIALFFNTGQYQRSRLPAELGCKLTPDGAVETDDEAQTCIRGAYLAGDASKDVQLAIVAAAEGARAAFAINKSLIAERFV